jgi:hypothetical protein
MNDFDITNRTVEAFTMYKFMDEITKDFREFDAYKQGIIDQDGYFKEDTGSIPTFDLFVIYIKRLLNEITNPATKARLNNLTSAMQLFRESLEDYGLNGDKIVNGLWEELVEQEMVAAPANNVGSGNIAGIPAGLEFIQDDEGFDNLVFRRKKKKKKDNPLTDMARRKAPVGLEGY